MSQLHPYLTSLVLGVMLGLGADSLQPGSLSPDRTPLPARNCSQPPSGLEFLVFGGGGSAQQNEISLEKNLRYFQRTLATLGFDPARARLYFASGNDGQATVRYLNPLGIEQFKPAEIANLVGASTRPNLIAAVQDLARSTPPTVFMYFTGHGNRNADLNNNTFNLWNDDELTVQQFSQLLDQLPQQTVVTIVMAQCFSGSFANLIYQGGHPSQPFTQRRRCGFFATIKTNPSVGCTPAVDEADYEDYSSSFFAGLSGRDRVGRSVPLPDYDRNGRVSYAEAHAFVKIDAQTPDLPLSTSEAWLGEEAQRQQLSEKLLSRRITQILATARPEQQAVVNALGERLQFDPQRSFWQQSLPQDDQLKTYWVRLGMELLNIAMEAQIRQSGRQDTIALLDRLITCEHGSPQG
uniref:Peptidase C14 caspase catalytic subunit p20 n=1 Tax=Cyanothece sp. (strain PCC 7425 / ATCC 29141) TaxID=395961 RepID=B8HVW0_CYAP4